MSNFNRTFLGGAHQNVPETVNMPAGVATLRPGHVAQIVDGDLIPYLSPNLQPVVVSEPLLRGLDYQYAEGETVFGYLPGSLQLFQLILAPGQVIAEGDPIGVNSSGEAISALVADPEDPAIERLFTSAETITAPAASVVTRIYVRRP